jgi:hypothetical protein
MATTLNLDRIVDISVYTSPQAAIRSTFNQLLIVGQSTHISANTRVKQYGSLAEMLDDSFIITDDEYLAAAVYFAQTPTPEKVWIGRMVSGTDTGAQALALCRAASSEWYVCMVLNADKTSHEACALWAESATPSTVYAYTTEDADVLSGVTGNVAEVLKGLLYKRTIGQYSSTYPLYAIAGIMGYAMGANTGLANSAYTLKFKNEVGITVEALTSTQVGIIEGNNCNVYVNYGNAYDIFEPGIMADGTFFDQVINRDMLVNDIQMNVMDLLYGNSKIPQTEAGVTQIIHAINQACESAIVRGYLGPGTWTGVDVLNLHTGDTLPKGYVVQAVPLSEQSTADRDLRKSPNIYVAIKEAGAMHSVLIGVYINQ